MKVTHRWLQEFSASTATPALLAEQLTLAGLEVESVTPVAPPFSGVVVGEVLAVAPHPDAARLAVCRVTTDGRTQLQIVCGAKNVRANLKVAVATVGAKLPNGIDIQPARLRGVESGGMLCSARELGLSEEGDGILELPAAAKLGEDLRIALDLDDSVLEVNATPNRGDCMSVLGIARDYVAAQERRYLRRAAPAVAARSQSAFPVTIVAEDACPLFGARVIHGIGAGTETPPWLRERLRRVGINSISPVVDVTNYVMIELGQPLHAYDLARLAGGLEVRRARAAEQITLLDERDYTLDPECLVIADQRGPVGLAGIMGGRATAISAMTTSVLLEAAHFRPAAMAGRARRFGLFTDAAQRFERGVDPGLPEIALERATALLLDIVGGEPGPVRITRSAIPIAEIRVPMRRSRLTRLLGTPVPDVEVRGILEAISETVEETADGWRLLAPSHRFDLAIEVDLIEEVARLRGFAAIPESHAVAPQIAGAAGETRVASERVLSGFVDQGYREVITYSFVEPALQRLLFPQTPALVISNPISADLSEMRVSLWPGLVRACADNLRRQQTRVRLLEIGKQFQLDGAEVRETEMVAGIVTGSRWPEQWGSPRQSVDFFDVKAEILAVLALTGQADSVHFEPDTLACLRPGRSARIYRDSVAVGWLGELHPQFIRTLNLAPATFVFDLEFESAFAAKVPKFKTISKFPVIRRDLAVVVDESISLAVLKKTVTVAVSGLLSELRVFDVYRGPGIEFGRKSVALGLILQDSSRTLTDVDADAVVAGVVARLRDELSATIRDQ